MPILWLLAETGVRSDWLDILDFWFMECCQFSFYCVGRVLIDFLQICSIGIKLTSWRCLDSTAMIIPIRAVLSSTLGNGYSMLQRRACHVYRLLFLWQADWQQAAITVFCCFMFVFALYCFSSKITADFEQCTGGRSTCRCCWEKLRNRRRKIENIRRTKQSQSLHPKRRQLNLSWSLEVKETWESVWFHVQVLDELGFTRQLPLEHTGTQRLGAA